MTFEPLKKGVIIIGKIYEDSAFETYIPIIVEHDVRSAVEGLKKEFREIERTEFDNDNVQYAIMAGTAQALVDKWFPVFGNPFVYETYFAGRFKDEGSKRKVFVGHGLYFERSINHNKEEKL